MTTARQESTPSRQEEKSHALSPDTADVIVASARGVGTALSALRDAARPVAALAHAASLASTSRRHILSSLSSSFITCVSKNGNVQGWLKCDSRLCQASTSRQLWFAHGGTRASSRQVLELFFVVSFFNLSETTKRQQQQTAAAARRRRSAWRGARCRAATAHCERRATRAGC